MPSRTRHNSGRSLHFSGEAKYRTTRSNPLGLPNRLPSQARSWTAFVITIPLFGRAAYGTTDGFQELFLLAFPAKCALRGCEHSYLSLSQGIRRAEKYIQARR